MITLYWSTQDVIRDPSGGDNVNLMLGSLELDILESDRYEISSLVTEHSVETREQITDHQVPQIDRVSFEAFISDRPNKSGVASAVYAPVTLSSGSKAMGLQAPEGTTRALDAFEVLRDLCRQGIQVDVEGLRRTVEGWMITNVSSPRNVQNAGGLACSISLQEVTTSTISEVDVPAPRVERARPNQDQGRQAGTETANTEVSSSPSDRSDSLQNIRDDFGWDPETGEVL